MGYEVVHVEVQTHRQKTLRIFIDFAMDGSSTIGIDDCVKVTRALEEPLEKLPEVESIFHGAYELEVSSPGVDRPLRTARDFTRFTGREARIHVFRPLSAEELENAHYQARNPKQKNFFGTVTGVTASQDGVRVEISPEGSSAGKAPGRKSSKKNKNPEVSENQTVTIPLSLISKANLEPRFEFDGDAVEIDGE